LTHAAPDSPLEIAREKYAAEQGLRDSPIGWTVVRSAAFAELWIELLEQTARRSHRPVVFGRGRTPLWWVSVEDVATEVVRVTLDRSTRGRTVDVVGPEGIGLEELARRVMVAHGWSGSPRRVPPALLHLGAATIGRVVPTVGRQLRAALAMDALSAEGPAAAHAAAGRRSVDDLLAAPRPPG
jgi:NADH dehydrogenase